MAAVPTAKEAEHHPALTLALVVGAVTGDRQGVDGAVSVGHRPLGVSQSRGAEDHVDHAQNRFGVATHRARTRSADHQAVGYHKVDRIEHARVGGHIGEHMLQSHITSGDCRGTRDVHRPGALRRGARKVQRQPVTSHGHVERNRQQLVFHAVVVQHVFKAVAAIGQAANVRAHQTHGTCAQLHQGLRHFGIAVFIQQSVQAASTQFERCQLAVQVTPQAVGQAGVRAQNGQHIVFQHTAAQDAHRRNLHRFLPTLGGRRVVVAGHRTAHVVPVCGRSQKAIQLTVAKAGLDQFEVVGVRAALIRVVEQPHVARLHAASLSGHAHGGAHGKSHGTHKHRQARLALDQGVAGDGIVQAVASVMRLGNDGVEGAAIERGVHLVGNLFESAAQHGQSDRVHCIWHW